MKRNEELLSRVAADSSLAPRSIYADWWLEHGDARGEYVAATLALENRLNPAQRLAFRTRAAQLLDLHRLEWTAELTALGAREPRFVRGFVEEVTVAEAHLANLDALLALEPIHSLLVELDDGGALAKAMGQPSFRFVTRLRLVGDADGLHGRLSGPLYTDGLATLILSEATGRALHAVATAPSLASLQRLSVSGTDARDVGLASLGASQLRLKELYAARIGATDGGVASLVASGAAELLEILALGGNRLTMRSARSLADAKLAHLRVLELGHNRGLVGAGLDALLALPALHTVELRGCLELEDLGKLESRLGAGLKW